MKSRRAVSRFSRAAADGANGATSEAEIVAESYEPGVTVCAVARRHGLTPQQLFTWRRLARKPLEVDVPMFAPAVVDVSGKAVAKEPERAGGSRKKSSSGAIELEIGGAIVRIASDADAATIVAVIQAVKAQS
ncbi:hypothetical protein BHMPCIPO_06471 [Ensifer sesbaniae]|nr:hypothetical protein [Ensifer sesbaniae]